ncbi:hypothetical protein HDK64DRAFT_257911 [Phyllosticta capitalensis]
MARLLSVAGWLAKSLFGLRGSFVRGVDVKDSKHNGKPKSHERNHLRVENEKANPSLPFQLPHTLQPYSRRPLHAIFRVHPLPPTAPSLKPSAAAKAARASLTDQAIPHASPSGGGRSTTSHTALSTTAAPAETDSRTGRTALGCDRSLQPYQHSQQLHYKGDRDRTRRHPASVDIVSDDAGHVEEVQDRFHARGSDGGKSEK